MLFLSSRENVFISDKFRYKLFWIILDKIVFTKNVTDTFYRIFENYNAVTVYYLF